MGRRRAVLVLGAAGLAAVAAGVVVNTMTGAEGLSLQAIPNGVSARSVGNLHVFLARDGAEVVAFVNSAQHMPGEKIWWCPKEQVFAAPTHGETFDAQGRHIGGPASRNLDRLTVTVGTNKKVAIDSSKVLAGAALGAPPSRPEGIPDLAAEWPPGFCGSHVAS